MKELPIKTRKVLHVEATDLDDYIEEVYGLNPGDGNIAVIEEVGNDVALNFTVNNDHLTPDEQEVIDKIKPGHVPYYCLSIILNDMCIKALIPSGDYLVNVSW